MMTQEEFTEAWNTVTIYINSPVFLSIQTQFGPMKVRLNNLDDAGWQDEQIVVMPNLLRYAMDIFGMDNLDLLQTAWFEETVKEEFDKKVKIPYIEDTNCSCPIWEYVYFDSVTEAWQAYLDDNREDDIVAPNVPQTIVIDGVEFVRKN